MVFSEDLERRYCRRVGHEARGYHPAKKYCENTKAVRGSSLVHEYEAVLAAQAMHREGLLCQS
jgi:hypothetical protein